MCMTSAFIYTSVYQSTYIYLNADALSIHIDLITDYGTWSRINSHAFEHTFSM